MMKLIILTTICGLALGLVDPPPPPDAELPQSNRIARQAPQMSDVERTMGSSMQQLGKSGQDQSDTIDPMGLIRKSQDIAKQMMTGRKRRDVPNRQELPALPSAP